jgi:hypothetical protein
MKIKGVYYDSGKKKWRARVAVDKVRTHIGWFASKEAAEEASRTFKILQLESEEAK